MSSIVSSARAAQSPARLLASRKNARWIALAAAGLALAAGSARAVDHTWDNSAGGSWTDPTKWSPNSVPTTDNVFIYHANQEATQIAYNASTYSSTTHDIRMDNNGSAGFFRFGNFLNHTAGSLTARRLIVGGRSNGIGGSAQSGGSTTLTSALELGTSTTGLGFYQLSSGSLNITGAGGGELGLFAGYGGEGTFDHTGGSVTTASNVPLVLARNSGSAGTYNLSGGAVIVNGNAYVGGIASAAGGTGALNISGGTMTTTGTLKAWNTGGTSVNLSAGTLNVGAIDTSGNPAKFNWTGGTLNVTGAGGLAIGPSGPIGSSVTLGPTRTLSVSSTLHIQSGSLALSGGTVNAAAISLAAAQLALGPEVTVASPLSFGLSYTDGALLVGDVNSRYTGTITAADAISLFLNGGVSASSELRVGGMANQYTGGSGARTNVDGAGTVSLPFSNDYQGDWAINGGTLSIGHASSLGTAFSPVDILGTLQINGVRLTRDIYLRNGGTLRGTGMASSLGLTHAELSSGSMVTLATGTSIADVFTISGLSAFSGLGGGSTITVSGAGHVVVINNDPYYGSWTIAASTLVVERGLFVDMGEAITGSGTVVTPNSPDPLTIINGTAQGDSAAAPLIFTGYVKGAGTFDHVTFTGTFDPGLSPTLTSAGSITLGQTNTLIMELGGTGRGNQYDAIVASGTLALNGTLQVSLINGFSPAAGNSFNLFDWASLAGTFDTFQLPALSGSLVWDTTQLYNTGVLRVAAPGLPGDYNNNGSVDAADYVLWRKGGPLANEVDTPGIVNAADYSAWRSRFGNPAASGASAEVDAAVPEPTALALLLIAMTSRGFQRRRVASSRQHPSAQFWEHPTRQ